MKIIIIFMTTYHHLSYFILVIFYVGDVKFPAIAQILSKAVVKMNGQEKSTRVAPDGCTCLIPDSYKFFTSLCFTVIFQKTISLGNKTSN